MPVQTVTGSWWQVGRGCGERQRRRAGIEQRRTSPRSKLVPSYPELKKTNARQQYAAVDSDTEQAARAILVGPVHRRGWVETG